MERGKLVVLLVVVLLFIFSIYLLLSSVEINNLKSNKKQENSQNIEIYSLIRLTKEDLKNGEMLELGLGDVVSLNVEEEAYSLKVLGIDKENSEVDFVVNSFLFFSVAANARRKLDLNYDDVYDTLIQVQNIMEESAKVSVSSISERRGVVDIVDSKVGSIMEKLDSEFNLQINIIIGLLITLLVLLIFYILRYHVLPVIRNRKALERERLSEVFDYVYAEMESAKKKKDKDKELKLANRIKHIYKYMNDKDKNKYEKKMKNMERYLNRFGMVS